MSRSRIYTISITILIVLGVIGVIVVRNQAISPKRFFMVMYGDQFVIDEEGNYLFQQSNPLLPEVPIQEVDEGTVNYELPFEITFDGIAMDDDVSDTYTYGKPTAEFTLFNNGIEVIEYGGTVTDVLLNGQWYNCVGIDHVAGNRYLDPGKNLRIVKHLVSRDSFKSYPSGHYRLRVMINSKDFIAYEFDLSS